MKTFRTVIHPEVSPWQIDHTHGILMLGSCFTDHIGKRLETDKMDVVYNPFGTLFNPNSIEHLIRRALESHWFDEKEFFMSQDVWRHWMLNTALTDSELPPLVARCNEQLRLLKNRLKKDAQIFITLGSAWVYRFNESGILVANCHKVPSTQFTKECMSVVQIESVLSRIVSLIETVNPEAKIIFTLSPIRHWKDGAIANAKSKAFLRAGIESVMRHPVHYFPSYELMMDDLRDYRFYQADMLHPSDQAIDYIYAFFGDTFFSKKTQQLNQQIQKINKALQHKAFNAETKAYAEHNKKTQMTLDQLLLDHPYLKKKFTLSVNDATS